jgi:3-isopropylmalate/(R)-2-methylmalate dehydratase large subunit
MGTLVEEIFSRKLVRQVKAGEIVMCEIDYAMSHDNTTPLAINAFRNVGKPIRFPDRIVIHLDHAYPAPNIPAAENHRKIIDFVEEHNLNNFFHQGVCHQVMIEEGFVLPGNIIIGGDSHSNTYGAFSALGVGFGSTEIGLSWITGKTWFKVPQTINVRLKGVMQKGVYAKDVMIHVAGKLGMDGATYKAVEFSGPYIEQLPMHERIIFSNMSTEIGAKCGLIASDETTKDFLRGYGIDGELLTIVPKDPLYEKVIEMDVSDLVPQVACSPTVDNVRPIDEVEGLHINQVYIGTCTNARYEDLEIAASILKGRKVNRTTRTIVTPASNRIFQKAMDNGLVKIFQDAGCVVTQAGCGACIGRHGGILASKERAFTTMNRNFLGRMGSPEAEIYLGSPAAAAATAIEGKIADPRRYIR